MRLPKKNSAIGQKSFSFHGAKLWNSLSAESKQASSLNNFKILSTDGGRGGLCGGGGGGGGCSWLAAGSERLMAGSAVVVCSGLAS